MPINPSKYVGIISGVGAVPGGGGSAPTPSPPPPEEFTFQTFNMTNGAQGQWVGFSTGAPTTPQPAFGSISAQPTAQATLLAFYDDTASGVVLAVFSGAHAAALADLEVSVAGSVLTAFEVEMISGNTWVRFTGAPGNWVSGAVYAVLFGWDLASPSVISFGDGQVTVVYLATVPPDLSAEYGAGQITLIAA